MANEMKYLEYFRILYRTISWAVQFVWKMLIINIRLIS